MGGQHNKNVYRKRPGERIVGGDRKRKAITLEEKLGVIKRFERNERTCDIARATGIKESTLRTIRDNAEKIKASCIAGTSLSASKLVRSRPKELEEMERLLCVWLEDQLKKQSGTSFIAIRQKALSIYEGLRNKAENPADVPAFSASSGWFAGFKNRCFLTNKLCGEAASTDEECAMVFPHMVKKFIEEEGYTLDQIFNLEETGLYWKRMPSRTYISKNEAQAPGFKVAKDRMTVLLGANASGDLKLKPVVVYHSANPRALKGYLRSTLGVCFRSSKRGSMTGQIFSDLIVDVFKDIFRNYCRRKDLDFKILLILDNAPSHPPTVGELSENIKVLFLPPNTTSLLQPMDQGAIAAFKAYYLRRTFRKLIAATEGDNKDSVLQFWKSFNIKNAIDIIVEAWGDVSKDCLRAVWQKLLPDFIHDFKGIELSEELPRIKEHCIALAKQVGFEEVESEDVEEVLESHCVDLSTADLQQLEAEGKMEAGDEEDEAQDAAPRELSTSLLSSILREVEKQLQLLEDNDYNAERSGIAVRGIRSYLAPYEQLLHERRKMAQQQNLFKPVPRKQSEDNELKPFISGLSIFRHNPASGIVPKSDDDDGDDPQPLS
ncbi:hypothetical protein chiPu_0012086 [Chiloscyllium punctatum]|uniref:HTH CENPB-type domain-containing protein n=1 Tax=Chiloscyllium punctatum TaxID=137246 RepID=A0A401STB1_CHIPU|nr:hypothetical protein [Chiloscyllium punctatum]